MHTVWGLVRGGLIVLITALTLVFGIRLAEGVYQSYFRQPAEVEVPALIGKDVQVADKLLNGLGLKMEVRETKFQAKVPADRIVSQDPPPGRKVRKDRQISVTVSMGPETVEVPDITGRPLREARLVLENQKLFVGKVVRKPEQGNAAEEVLEQEPEAGTRVKKGTRLTLTVTSGGKSAVTVPNYEGMQIAEVRDRVASDGLKLGMVNWVLHPSAPAGEVVQQNPGPRVALAAGSGVDLQVSAGSDPKSLEIRRTWLEYFVPAGASMQQIRVEVNDATGSNVVYEAPHAPGQKIDLTITALGEGEYLVYSDDRLIKREKI